MRYVLSRLGHGLLVLALVTVVVFLAIRAVPGDVVRTQLADSPGVTEEMIAQRSAELGLDEPILTQFGTFASGLVRGDLGNSFILQRLPPTLELGALALVLGVVLGAPMGMLAAVRRNSTLDQTMRVLAVLGLSIPSFWLALLLITFLSRYVGWSPPLVYQGPTENLGDNLAQMALPVIALATATMAVVARMVRSSMLEVLGSNFIRTVRARGASEFTVLVKHAGRSSLLSVFTVLGLQVGAILGGTVLLEGIFSIPGMGSYVFEAVQMRDYPAVIGSVIFYGGLFIIVNLIVDIVYAVIDPRIRY